MSQQHKQMHTLPAKRLNTTRCVELQLKIPLSRVTAVEGGWAVANERERNYYRSDIANIENASGFF